MSLHVQKPGKFNTGTRPRYYHACHCGVVGPLRRTRLLAALDEGAHAEAHAIAERTGVACHDAVGDETEAELLAAGYREMAGEDREFADISLAAGFETA